MTITMKRIIVLIPALLFSLSLLAQRNKNIPPTGSITCSEFAISRPLSEIAKEFPVDESKPYEKEESEDRENRKPQRFKFTVADGPEYGNDPATIQTKMGTVGTRAPLTSWPGQTATGFRPYDPSGAAGPSHYVQMINSTTFKVYNKTTGSVILTATLGNLWSPATGNAGDPIVLYDKAADRWFLAQFGTSSDRKIYIAISTTGDPTGTYYTYTFVSPAFPDYLKFGVWADGYYMTSNQAQKVFAFERTAMLAGNAASRAVYQSFSPPQSSGFFCPLPGDAADGTLPTVGAPCPIFSYSDNGWGAGYSDAVNIYQMSVDWVPTTPTATITLAANVATATFDASYNSSWNDVSQPGTTQKLDGIGGVCMYRAQWKSWSGYNTIVLNWAVNISATQRSIKWCELRQDQSTGSWSMYQEGIYLPDAATRWMGSIAMDDNGSIGMGYIKTDASAGIYPGLYYTGRRSCDPLGTLPITESLVIAGTGSQTGVNRVGDYAQLSMDPDGITFWYTGEYMGGTTGGSAARTHIYSFQLPNCSNAAAVFIAQTSGSNPMCPGASATFTATPTNGGSAPVYQWKVNGTNVGTNSTTYSTSSLVNGDVVTCVMTSNQAGVTGNPATSNAITMTVNSVSTPSVTIAQTAGTNPICAGSSATFTATPVNGGTTPSYQWQVNGSNVGTNSGSYSSSSLTNGQTVSCIMTSNALCVTTPTANSNTLTVAVQAVGDPVVTIAQTGGTAPACAGATLTYTATVTGGTPTFYQWKVDGANAGASASTFSSAGLGNGQTVSCTVTATPTCPVLTYKNLGTATTTNASTSSLGAAYPTYYGNGRQQYLIRASELTALGLSAGNMASIGFTTGTTLGDPATLNGYTIKIGTTTATAASATFLAPTFTTVYGPVNYTPTLSATNTHVFNTPFTWNGTSNLVVDICFSNQVVGNAAYATRYSSPGFNASAYYQADGAGGAGACTQATGATSTRRPNMVIAMANPTAMVNSNVLTANISALHSISGFAPTSGGSGTSVVITGTGFVNVTSVLFNGTPATSYTVNSPNQITAIAPAATTGPVTVLTSDCGAVNAAGSFNYGSGLTLNLKLYIEGFYLGGGQMIGVLSPSVTDTVTAELASASPPYTILHTAIGTVSTAGNASFVFPSAILGNSYYFVVKQRNTLETWSASPVLCNVSPITYDFSTGAATAYGSNLSDLKDGRYGIWSGDVNQDGLIESTDYSGIENAVTTFLYGYVPEDLTGDNIVEASDYSLVENNALLFLFAVRP